MITNLILDSWQDLQHQTTRILEECRFTVVLDKKLKTVRGEVEIDVLRGQVLQLRRKNVEILDC